MVTTIKGKASRRAAARPFQSNHLISLAAHQNGFDAFHSTENASETQDSCHLCHPNLHSNSLRAVKLCSTCAAQQLRLEAELLKRMTKPGKVVRLHRCSGCQKTVAPAKFSRDWGICKACVADTLSKSKLARSNFVERAVNNFRKMLKGVAAL